MTRLQKVNYFSISNVNILPYFKIYRKDHNEFCNPVYHMP